MRFEHWKTADGKWSWHLKTSAGDVLATGRRYTSEANCLAAIKLVRLSASAPSVDISGEPPTSGAERRQFRVQPV